MSSRNSVRIYSFRKKTSCIQRTVLSLLFGVCVCGGGWVGGVTVLSNSSGEDIGSAPGKKAALVTGFLKILMSAWIQRERDGQLLPQWQYFYCMWAKVLQLCPTLCHPMDCSPPGSSVHAILQARILEWFAMPFTGDLPDYLLLFLNLHKSKTLVLSCY